MQHNIRTTRTMIRHKRIFIVSYAYAWIMTHSLPTGREMRIGSVDRAHKIRALQPILVSRTNTRMSVWQHACTHDVRLREEVEGFIFVAAASKRITHSLSTVDRHSHSKGHTPVSLYGRLLFGTTVKWYERCLKVNEDHFRVRILRPLHAVRHNLVLWHAYTLSPQSRR